MHLSGSVVQLHNLSHRFIGYLLYFFSFLRRIWVWQTVAASGSLTESSTAETLIWARRMLNEAAARSLSAADVGGESIGGIITAYDNTTTSKIHPALTIRGRAERTQQWLNLFTILIY